MYHYADAAVSCAHDYLLPAVRAILLNTAEEGRDVRRIFDLGCGNGSIANTISGWGFDVIGVDDSAEGVAQANAAFPCIKIERGSAYDDLAARYGTFPIVLSLEVIEHLFDPRRYAKTVFDLLQPRGMAIISTPYHGYLKNVALAVSGKLDRHFTALWDGGHIKFWSMDTLGELLRERGFSDVEFRRVGRMPALAKSMIAIARKG